jgi:hypothetical protein
MSSTTTSPQIAPLAASGRVTPGAPLDRQDGEHSLVNPVGRAPELILAKSGGTSANGPHESPEMR